jgi:hypothetical protein
VEWRDAGSCLMVAAVNDSILKAFKVQTLVDTGAYHIVVVRLAMARMEKRAEK